MARLHLEKRTGLNVLGLERIGSLAIRFPRLSGATIVLLSIFCLVMIVQSLSFDGNFNRMIEGGDDAYRELVQLERNFRVFSQDEVILVKSPALATVEGYAQLRDLSIELLLIDHVDALLSAFSLNQVGEDGKTFTPLLPDEFDSNDALRATLRDESKKQPALSSLLNIEQGVATIVVMPRKTEINDSGFTPEALAKIEAVLTSASSSNFKLFLVGRPAIQRAVVTGIITDQMVLTAFAIVVCALIAFLVFRTPPAAAICTLAPVAALIWYLGLQSALGISVNFLSTIVPVLLMVMTFADGLHLFFDWRRRVDAGVEARRALQETLAVVGPACVLAHVTTAVAFLALVATNNNALIGLAVSGIAAVTIGLIAVMVVLPVSVHWAMKLDMSFKPLDRPILISLAGPGRFILQHSSNPLLVIALAGTVTLSIVHFLVPGQFRLMDYIPYDSDVRQGITAADRYFGGSARIFVSINRTEARNTITSGEVDQLRHLQSIVTRNFGNRPAISIVGAATQSDPYNSKRSITLPKVEDSPSLQWVISRDRSRFLITVLFSLNRPATETKRLISDLRQAITKAIPEVRVTITGSTVAHAFIIPKNITALRHGLIASILISVLVIGAAFRSWRVGLACLMPNILPVLGAETAVFWLREGIDMTSAVALTIGFGLAVDDSVHLLNHYVIHPAYKTDRVQAMSAALEAVTPALIATTVVLSCGLFATFFSTLPTVSLFGGVLIAILILALLSDIFVLPANALMLEKRKAL